MSVLACDRNGCENIMCDTLVHKKYYVCDECCQEFIELSGTQNFNENILFEKFLFFIETKKKEFPTSECTAEQFLDKCRFK